MFLIFFVLVLAAEATATWQMDQAGALQKFKVHKHRGLTDAGDFTVSRVHVPAEAEEVCDYTDHLMTDGLPGQPADVNFSQFAGNINVDDSTGRSLFYYFAESPSNSTLKPLIVWLNGGPGCSSLGLGAFTEVGPFGVNRDGKTLYARQFAWNQVANVLFLESPAGVGFSYSKTTSDYDFSGDKRTAEDTYVFLVRWFRRFPQYQGRDLYLVGESYAGHYVPELASLILENDNHSTTPMMNLQGIMVGNGLIDDVSDTRGFIDFAWSHGLVADDTRVFFQQSCNNGSLHGSKTCSKALERVIMEIGNLDFFNIYGPLCKPSSATGLEEPCDLSFVGNYLNLPKVQEALHANKTKLPYPWTPCSHVMHKPWHDSPSSMFPIYKRLIGHGLNILLYSGDLDLSIPFTSSRDALDRMGLNVIKPWHWWAISDTLEVAGYKVVYEGLTYVTVRGAALEVSRSYPDRLYFLLNSFISKSW